MRYQSAAVGLDAGLASLAAHADQLGVLTAVHAEGHAAAHPCQEEQGEAPDPGHSSRHLPGDVVRLPPAERAHQPRSWDQGMNVVDRHHVCLQWWRWGRRVVGVVGGVLGVWRRGRRLETLVGRLVALVGWGWLVALGGWGLRGHMGRRLILAVFGGIDVGVEVVAGVSAGVLSLHCK